MMRKSSLNSMLKSRIILVLALLFCFSNFTSAQITVQEGVTLTIKKHTILSGFNTNTNSEPLKQKIYVSAGTTISSIKNFTNSEIIIVGNTKTNTSYAKIKKRKTNLLSKIVKKVKTVDTHYTKYKYILGKDTVKFLEFIKNNAVVTIVNTTKLLNNSEIPDKGKIPFLFSLIEEAQILKRNQIIYIRKDGIHSLDIRPPPNV